MKIKTAIFPVAGYGTRFLPIVKTIPKEMLNIIDKPLIHYVVEEAKQAGIEKFIFITSQNSKTTEDYFDANLHFESFLNYKNNLQALEVLKTTNLIPSSFCFVRQAQPMGLGHAIWCAKNLIQEDNFAVLLSDDFIVNNNKGALSQMISAYNKSDGNMIATTKVLKQDVSKYGILEIDDKDINNNKIYVKSVVEKPKIEEAPSTFAIIGRYILNKSIFKYLDQLVQEHNKELRSEIQITTAIDMAKQNAENITGYLYQGKRFDCGSKKGWLMANIEMAMTNKELSIDEINSLGK